MKSCIKNTILACSLFLMWPINSDAQINYSIATTDDNTIKASILKDANFTEGCKKYGINPSTVQFEFEHIKYYTDCDGDGIRSNYLRCDGDNYKVFVYLSTPKDDKGVYYETEARFEWTRNDRNCYLTNNYRQIDWSVDPWQIFGKGVEISDNQAFGYFKKAFSNYYELGGINRISSTYDYEIVKIKDVRYNAPETVCAKQVFSDNMETASRSYSDRQVLSFSADLIYARMENGKSMITQLQKLPYLINIVLTPAGEISRIRMDELNCEARSEEFLFNGNAKKPYDSLFANLRDHGIESVFEHTTSIEFPKSSLVYQRLVYQAFKAAFAEVGKDRITNQKLLEPYLNPEVLNDWLDALDQLQSYKKGTIKSVEFNDESLSLVHVEAYNNKGMTMSISRCSFMNSDCYDNVSGKLKTAPNISTHQ